MIVMLSLFFLIAGSLAGLSVIVLLLISCQRFLEGEVKRFVLFIIMGILFLYLFTLFQLLIEFLALEKLWFNLIKGFLVYLSFVFFTFATTEIYRISEVLGFSSKKTPRKLKKILESK